MRIKSLGKLASVLNVSQDYLVDVSARSYTLYRPYKKPKRNGKDYRIIDNPSKEIKQLQKRIERFLLRPLVAELPAYIHGGRRGKSAATNALIHTGRPCLLSLDLSNCFSCISYSMVYTFYLTAFSCVPPVAKVLTRLTTFDNHLPQGGVTSPALCNLILAPLVACLANHAEDTDLQLTNYIDDIFVSGEREKLRAILPAMLTTIKDSLFCVNYEKLILTPQNKSMLVTGVVVNQKTSIGRKRMRNIERQIIKARTAGKSQVDHKTNVARGSVLYAYSINKNQGSHLRNRLYKN